ncbi:MAG: dihydroxy-acid dehydratase [Rhodobacteraceae bacterium]|nr:dihydroxy-acid dehydratase [Paracoccaceae bacterium]
MRFGFLALSLVLCNCSADGETPAFLAGFEPGAGSIFSAPPPNPQLGLFGGAIIAAGPEGFCADRRASRPNGGFALFASCDLLAMDESGAVAPRQLISIQAGRPGSATVSGQEVALNALLHTDAGATILSASGDAASVTVSRVEVSPGLVMVRFADVVPAAEGLHVHEWRAFMDVGGRLVTIGLRAPAAAPLSERAGLALLRQAASAFLQANSLPG